MHEHYDIDLSLSRNPLGCSRLVQEKVDLKKVDVSEYPESDVLIKAISSHFSVPKESIVIEGGIDGLINFLPQVFLNKGDKVLMAKTTFPRFKMATKAFGGKPVFVPLKNMRLDCKVMMEKVLSVKPKMIFIANPNNPTGLIEDKNQIIELIKKVKSLVVVDEAGIDLAGEEHSLISRVVDFKNLIVLRGFSKGYGLSGLRIGFCVASPEIIARFSPKRLTFPVTSIAIKAAATALSDQKHLKKTRELFQKEGKFFRQELERMGFEVLPPESNLIFAKVPSCFSSASEFIKELHKQNIHCVDGGHFGLPMFIRINPSVRKINSKFIMATEKILKR